MSAGISLFPTLTDELRSKIRFEELDYKFYYLRDDEKFELKAEPMEGTGTLNKIIDEEGVWTPDDYNFCISNQYSLRTYKCLFGENGIACHDATLGIALMWRSQDSKQRGVIPIGDIENSEKDLTFKLEYEFHIAQLRGNVQGRVLLPCKGSKLSVPEHPVLHQQQEVHLRRQLCYEKLRTKSQRVPEYQ